MDQMKQNHDKRKKAIAEEAAIRQKRLEDATNEVLSGIQELTNFHGYLSLLDMDRYKNKTNHELSTAINLIATSLTHLNKFAKEELRDKK